jgi:hypothetical protein
VHIYLESNNEHYILEQPDYEFATLLSDVGGVIGLYLGMAVVSLVEVLESCALLVYVYWQKSSELQNKQVETQLSPNLLPSPIACKHCRLNPNHRTQ